VLAVSPTIGDPSQAPPGKHTIKIIGMQPYDLKEGRSIGTTSSIRWRKPNLNWLRKFSPNLTADKILAQVVESPLDLERRNPHNWHGSCHGGAQNARRRRLCGLLRAGRSTACRSPGSIRPVPRRTPADSISGGPGRNAAAVMLKDFGRSLDELVADKKPNAPARVSVPAK